LTTPTFFLLLELPGLRILFSSMTTTSSSSLSCFYQTAAYLNNVGVTLMQRQQYKAASHVFHGAVHILKCATGLPGTTIQLHDSMQAADEQLAVTSHCTTKESPFLVVSDADHHLLPSSSCSQFMLIQLDAFDGRLIDSAALNIETAIIVYNNAHALLYRHHGKSAFKLLQLADTMLSLYVQERCEIKNLESTQLDEMWYSLQRLVLITLVDVAPLVGPVQCEQATGYQHRLASLPNMEDTTMDFLGGAPTAARAA